MILDRFRLSGRVAIVTGAGRGIGAACALALAEAGADVVLTARTREQLDIVARQVAETGQRALVHPADVNELDALSAVVDDAMTAFGRIDIVVNNAGGTAPVSYTHLTLPTILLV